MDPKRVGKDGRNSQLSCEGRFMAAARGTFLPRVDAQFHFRSELNLRGRSWLLASKIFSEYRPFSEYCPAVCSLVLVRTCTW